MRAIDIKEFAGTLGFTLVGIAPVQHTPEGDYYAEWIDRGYAGTMDYLERQKAARLDPQLVLPGARSAIVCAIHYNTDHLRTSSDRLRAWVSRYAWGRDYHKNIERRVRMLARWLESNGPARTRAYVDTGPLTERVFAKYAGIGWFGKNTCIINQNSGSWFFLGCILTDLEIEPDTPAPDRCGTCTRCLDACPTDAFVAPYVLDSRRCISYLTIELRGTVPEAQRAGIGQHLFGCDICQDVCPWNRRAPITADPDFQPKEGLLAPEIETLLNFEQDDWTRLIQGTAMKRAKVPGLVRNLMTVAGNSGVAGFLPKLRRFLQHEDARVREHAAWAIAQLEDEEVLRAERGNQETK